MSHTVTLGTPVIAGLMALLAIWLRRRLDRQDAATAERDRLLATAAANAALAAARSEPTGNGYAARTEEALERIERRVIRLEDRLEDHIDRRT